MFTENFKNRLSTLLEFTIEIYGQDNYNMIVSEIEDNLFLERDKEKRITLLIEWLKKYRGQLIAQSKWIEFRQKRSMFHNPYRDLVLNRLSLYSENPTAYGNKDKIQIQKKEEELKDFEQFYQNFYGYIKQLIAKLKTLKVETSRDKSESTKVLSDGFPVIEKNLKNFTNQYFDLQLGLIDDENTDEIIRQIVMQFKGISSNLRILNEKIIANLLNDLKLHSYKILDYSNQIEKEIEEIKKKEILHYFSMEEIKEFSQIYCTNRAIEFIENKIRDIEGGRAKHNEKNISKKVDYPEDIIQDDTNIHLQWKENVDLLYEIFNDLRITQQKDFKMKIMLDKATEEDIDDFITTNFKDEHGNEIKSRFKNDRRNKTKHKKLLWRGYLNSLVKLFYMMKTKQILNSGKIGLYDPNDNIPQVINRNFMFKEKNARGNITNRAIYIATVQKFLGDPNKLNKKILSAEAFFS